MRTHVALLRGVNVGGNNKVPMAELRKLAVELGHGDVATYIQSGNLVFSTARTDADGLAAQLEREIAARLGVTTTVVVVSRAELAQVVADNPYPHEQDPKHLHAVFRQQPFDEAGRTGVAAALEPAANWPRSWPGCARPRAPRATGPPSASCSLCSTRPDSAPVGLRFRRASGA